MQTGNFKNLNPQHNIKNLHSRHNRYTRNTQQTRPYETTTGNVNWSANLTGYTTERLSLSEKNLIIQ